MNEVILQIVNFFSVVFAMSVTSFIFVLSSFCVMINDGSIRRNKMNKFPHLIAMTWTLLNCAYSLSFLYINWRGQY